MLKLPSIFTAPGNTRTYASLALLLAPFSLTYAGDSDGDGFEDVVDNCPFLASANQADSDNDGRGDLCDNCTGWANPTQADSDHDGYGNACDGDFNGDQSTNFADLSFFRTAFGSATSPANLLDEATTNVDLADLLRLKALFFEAPGPSGLPVGQPNQAPSVNAGADVTATLSAGSTSLEATVSDDYLPSGNSLNMTWSQVSGPAGLSFGDINSADTSVNFNTAGDYVLRLTVTDGALSRSDDVALTVSEQTASPACQSPISPVDTSSPDTVVGTGTPESCTETQLASAVAQGGIITFNCGAGNTTINLTETLQLRVDTDTVIDGDGRITLDAGHSTRHFYFYHPDWMNNQNRVVLQGLTLINGKAPAGEFFPQDSNNPLCAWGYKEGSGGAIFIRNGVLHVINSHFQNNEAALVGPDVGGGAIYALGVPEIIISGSTFTGNRGANAGAVGMLWANPGIYNSVFENNTSEGTGMNYVEPGCPRFNHDEQGGAGGNGGAIAFDGMNDDGVVFTLCGSRFTNNRSNELGGAIFRTPNVAMRDMLIDKSLFDSNTARLGAVSFIKQNNLSLKASTLMNNQGAVLINGDQAGGAFGGLWINQGNLTAENSTFFNNHPDGLTLEAGNGNARNITFVDSSVTGVEIDNSVFSNVGCDQVLNGTRNLQWPVGNACTANVTFANPELGPLGDNGGPTPTFLPTPDGPVNGVGTNCPDMDQRGETRDINTCDVGAVESN
ncbi:MAG: choice-of-anchor Q domain-containing protein [bacterium]